MLMYGVDMATQRDRPATMHKLQYQLKHNKTNGQL